MIRLRFVHNLALWTYCLVRKKECRRRLSYRFQAFSRSKSLSCDCILPVLQGSFRERIAKSASTNSGINSMRSSRATNSNFPSFERLYLSLISLGITMHPCLSIATSNGITKYHYHINTYKHSQINYPCYLSFIL